MSDVFRTMVVPADQAPLARAIANMFAGSDQHMWIVGLSADGAEPATHYISTGPVPDQYEVMAPWQVWQQQEGQWVMTDSYPGQPDQVWAACQAADPPVVCTLQDVQDLFTAADVTDEDPWTSMGRLGLQPVYTEQQP